MSAKQREINALLEDAQFRDLAGIGLAFKDVPLEELEERVAEGLREGRERRRKERERASTTS